MDKGKVFRNLAKKKLAEYIQEKEVKGEQETTHETVPTVKEPIKKGVRRTPYKINLEIEGKKGKFPFVINANLSIAERKRLIRVATAVSNALKLDTASALAIRFENLLKNMTNEADKYSIDYIEALEGFIKNIYEKVRDLVRKNQNINQAKNNLNQIIELLDEKKEEKIPTEEGEPAEEEGVKEIKLNVGQPYEEEEEEEQEGSEGFERIPQLRFGEITGTTELDERKREIKEELSEAFEEIYSRLQTIALRNELYNLCNKFAKGLKKRKNLKTLNEGYERIKAIMNELEEYAEPVAAPAAAAEEEEEEEAGGMRKTKHKIYRGYTGYGKIFNHGTATNPMNANSPFNQPAFRAPQSSAIPKYLNFEIIPNKRGNFAVLK